MCDEICKHCGGDDATAKIGRAMGFRPDIAFAKIKQMEAKIDEAIAYGEDHLVLCNHNYAVEHIVKLLKELKE